LQFKKFVFKLQANRQEFTQIKNFSEKGLTLKGLRILEYDEKLFVPFFLLF